MKNIYLTTILLGAISLSGYGGGDNSTPNSIQQSDIQKYKIVATPTSGKKLSWSKWNNDN